MGGKDERTVTTVADWYCTGSDMVRPVEGKAPVLFKAWISEPEVVACGKGVKGGGEREG